MDAKVDLSNNVGKLFKNSRPFLSAFFVHQEIMECR